MKRRACPRSGRRVGRRLVRILALRLGQPLCLSSIAATADNGMAEMETTLTPVSFNGEAPTRFFGLVQVLSDPTPLLGRAIAYQRLVGSEMIQEDEPLPSYTQNMPPPPPPPATRVHPRAPWLRLVVSEEKTDLNFESGELFDRMRDILGRFNAKDGDIAGQA